MTTVTFTASGTWNAAANSVDCEGWGEGGDGANGVAGGGSRSGGGGSGGEFARESALAVTSGSNYPYTIGSGGTGTNTVFAGDAVTVTAHHGNNGSAASGGAVASGSTNSSHFNSGSGGNGIVGSTKGGGGGGSSAGTASAGTNGGAGGAGAGSGGTAPSGGGDGGNGSSASANNAQGGSVPGGGGGGGSTHAGSSGGAGAAGQISLTYTAATTGTASLSGEGTMTAAGGAAGMATLAGVGTLTAARAGAGVAALPGVGTMTATATQRAGASLAGAGTMSATGGTPTPSVVNQWSNSYGQGTAFGSVTSALQSCVVPLSPAFSVGGGSGVASEGNWLFAIASWTQDPQIINVHTGVSDDIHSWWRQYPAAGSGQNVRTAVSYTPNLARSPGYVYVAPDMSIAAICVLVVEVSGLGPWDTVVGTNTNYTSSGTSVALSLSAPAQPSFFIGGVGGDNVASGQAFAPSGYTALSTVTQTDGSDTVADNILTSAYRASSSASQSVSGTSSSSEDLSGFLIGVYLSGIDPIPATQNPAWPYAKFEAAFGAGFNTPNSELTWTDLTTRLWSWDEITGIQYQLGQLQATNLNFEVDNYDGALTPAPSPWSFTVTGTPSGHGFFTVSTAQSASISVGDGFTDTTNAGTFFVVTNIGAPSGGNVNVTFTPSATSVMASPDVVTQASLTAGTPIRLRMALGVIGGQTVDRWYVIQRNVHEWAGEINANYRRWCPVSGTDLWSAMSAVAPTFYRSEIYEDSPYAWWPMDDQPLEGGVLPVTLLNAAPGNTNTLGIEPSPGGVSAQDTYGFNGSDITAAVTSGGFFFPTETTPPAGSVATYAAGANAGWMYGDPPSATSSVSAAGNPVEASPGSASWQQSGLLGATGSAGWYLIGHDASFPGLSGGITVKGWFNAGLFGNGSGMAYVPGFSFTDTSLCGQPYAPITICELATSSNPVCILQLDISGHLNLITYNGSTGTSHSIYSASDLRSGSWVAVDMTLTTTTWHVQVNGGVTADVSGSATGMTSAWTYLILCGDFGSGGGASPSGLAHGGNMALSHWAVFPYILPDWRILAHYTAAITGFGLLPAPAAPAISPVSSPPVNVSTQVAASPQNTAGYQTTPDGLHYDGSYGKSGNSPVSYSYSLVATANAGSYSSGPSARTTTAGIGQIIQFETNQFNTWGYALWLSWTGTAPQFSVYSSSSAATEKLLGTVVADGTSVTSGYGSGASPPTAATPLGDTVGQRIERLLRAGRCTSPQRSVDPSTPLVQAPGVSGTGQQVSSAVEAIRQSDSGFLYVDNVGNLTYWMRSHLAAQYSSPVWNLTPDAPPTPGADPAAIPYYREHRLVNDPQRVWNVITVQPFSPTGAQLPLLTPTNSSGVRSSQIRYGAQPLAITSFLQDQASMQEQADWLFANYGTPQTRADNVRIDAAPYPAAWILVAGINVGDLVTLEEWQVGGGGQVLTLRATEINRKIRFGGQNEGNAGEGTVVASVELILDAEPSSYWGV